MGYPQDWKGRFCKVPKHTNIIVSYWNAHSYAWATTYNIIVSLWNAQYRTSCKDFGSIQSYREEIQFQKYIKNEKGAEDSFISTQGIEV